MLDLQIASLHRRFSGTRRIGMANDEFIDAETDGCFM